MEHGGRTGTVPNVEDDVTVTIKDVAREANVSPATVSRVFNDTARVDDATRQRVLAAAERLRYVPNAAARSLIISRTATVGVLLRQLHGSFSTGIIRGLEVAARRRGFHLLVTSSQRDPSAAAAAVRRMRGRVDGMIVMSSELPPELLRRAIAEDQAVVLLGGGERPSGVSTVAIDYAGGAAAMVRHLIRHGHRRIGILAGTDGDHESDRVRGYGAALHDAGIEPDDALQAAGTLTEDGGYAAARALLALDPRPTAIFAVSDAMAVGAMAALREAGVSVPDEMAIAGFGDAPVARYLDPPLSSVRAPTFEMGRVAFERLLFAVTQRTRAAATHDLLECSLAPRASCGVHGED